MARELPSPGIDHFKKYYLLNLKNKIMIKCWDSLLPCPWKCDFFGAILGKTGESLFRRRSTNCRWSSWLGNHWQYLKFDFKEQRSTAAVKKSRMTFISNQPGKAKRKQAKVNSSHEMVQKARNLKLGLFFYPIFLFRRETFAFKNKFIANESFQCFLQLYFSPSLVLLYSYWVFNIKLCQRSIFVVLEYFIN